MKKIIIALKVAIVVALMLAAIGAILTDRPLLAWGINVVLGVSILYGAFEIIAGKLDSIEQALHILLLSKVAEIEKNKADEKTE